MLTFPPKSPIGGDEEGNGSVCHADEQGGGAPFQTLAFLML